MALCWAGLLGLSLAPRSARAQAGEAEAALVPIPSPEATAEEVAQALTPLSEELERRYPGRVLSPDAAARRLGEPDPGRRLAGAAAAATEARSVTEAFDDLELAVDLLQGAARRFLLLLPLLSTVEEPLSLLRDLAVVFLALDREDRLEATLAEAARLDPSLPVDPERDPSRLVEAARQVREQRVPTLALLNPHIAAAYAELLGVRWIIVGRLGGRGELRLEIYDGEDGRRTARLDTDGQALDRAAPRFARELGLEPAEPPEEADGDARPRPWYRSWWFITTVIVGVAVITTVTAVGINAAVGDD